VAPSGVMVIPNVSLASENGNGEITGGDGAREFISTHVPLPTFNSIMEFFHEL